MKERENRISWNNLFIEISKLVAQRSPDPHTQVGAVIVQNNTILSIGYNGGISNFNYDFDWSDSSKYTFCVHAESNALANAAKIGANVDGADIYLTLSPCKDCIKLLIQSGIKNVYYISEYGDIETTKLIANSTKTISLCKVEENKE